MKDYCGDDSKTSKGSASTPATFTRDSEPSDKGKKDKKKKYWQGKKDSKELKDSTNPAFGVNAAEFGGKEMRRKKKDVSEITCFNCNKKRHYSSSCIESPKN